MNFKLIMSLLFLFCFETGVMAATPEPIIVVGKTEAMVGESVQFCIMLPIKSNEMVAWEFYVDKLDSPLISGNFKDISQKKNINHSFHSFGIYKYILIIKDEKGHAVNFKQNDIRIIAASWPPWLTNIIMTLIGGAIAISGFLVNDFFKRRRDEKEVKRNLRNAVRREIVKIGEGIREKKPGEINIVIPSWMTNPSEGKWSYHLFEAPFFSVIRDLELMLKEFNDGITNKNIKDVLRSLEERLR